MKMYLVLMYDEAAMAGISFPSQTRMDKTSILYHADNCEVGFGRVYDEASGVLVAFFSATAGTSGLENIQTSETRQKKSLDLCSELCAGEE